MRCYIVNGDKFEIKQFKNFIWRKKTRINELPQELQNVSGLIENINQNKVWYCCENDEYILWGFFTNIGVEPHPLVELAYVCNWYNSNYGGVYIIGKDKKTGALFAPVVS